jgi:hypothetical protein
MIYFRKREILIESEDEIERLLNQSTSKVLTMFDLTSTSAYVILEERPFVGQKLSNGETIISRYRHSLFRIVPRIISKWKVENINGKSLLVIKDRLGLFPTVALFMVLFPLLGGCIKSVLNFELPDLELLFFSLGFLVVFLLLVKYELRQTSQVIEKVIKNEKVKSLVTI